MSTGREDQYDGLGRYIAEVLRKVMPAYSDVTIQLRGPLAGEDDRPNEIAVTWTARPLTPPQLDPALIERGILP